MGTHELLTLHNTTAMPPKKSKAAAGPVAASAAKASSSKKAAADPPPPSDAQEEPSTAPVKRKRASAKTKVEEEPRIKGPDDVNKTMADNLDFMLITSRASPLCSNRFMRTRN